MESLYFESELRYMSATLVFGFIGLGIYFVYEETINKTFESNITIQHKIETDENKIDTIYIYTINIKNK
jgi:hypothetical protein